MAVNPANLPSHKQYKPSLFEWHWSPYSFLPLLSWSAMTDFQFLLVLLGDRARSKSLFLSISLVHCHWQWPSIPMGLPSFSSSFSSPTPSSSLSAHCLSNAVWVSMLRMPIPMPVILANGKAVSKDSHLHHLLHRLLTMSTLSIPILIGWSHRSNN